MLSPPTFIQAEPRSASFDWLFERLKQRGISLPFDTLPRMRRVPGSRTPSIAVHRRPKSSILSNELGIVEVKFLQPLLVRQWRRLLDELGPQMRPLASVPRLLLSGSFGFLHHPRGCLCVR